ncbi:MAG: lipocalin-like domain-containing protein [Methylobacteriaceae bacterium]|nr:lipocalin-like domain-containing protein [Methylobacteriaceae bacterium]MBV9246064.1 lipocalin-like domain-containing protein [Methylobacteriaceae bacterium]
MKKISRLAIGLLGVAGAAGIYPVVAAAQSSNSLVGTWNLVSLTYDQNGKPTKPYGESPKGIQVLGSDGRVVVILLKPDLPKFASNNRVNGTPEENKAVVQGSLAYFGTYAVNDNDKTISVQIDAATFPNWMGLSQKRTFTLNGDELTVMNTTSTVGLPSTTVWKRVK